MYWFDKVLLVKIYILIIICSNNFDSNAKLLNEFNELKMTYKPRSMLI